MFSDEFLSKVQAIPDPRQPQPEQQQNVQNFEHPEMQSKPNMLMQGLKNYAKLYNQGVSLMGTSGINMGLGAAQGAYDAGKSVADIVPGMTRKSELTGESISKLPDVNLSQYVQGDDDVLNKIEYGAGYLGSQGAGDVGIYKGLSKLPKLGEAGWKIASAKAGATGALTGENVPGGRGVAATLGAIGAPIGGIKSKPIAEDIANAYSSAKSKYSALYNDWFGKTAQRDIGNMKAPNIDLEALKPLSGANKDYLSLKRYLSEPSFENAHKAQSDLYKLANKAEFGAPDSVRQARNYAFEARKKINGAAAMKLSQSGNADLIPEYAAIQKGYKEEVAPYLNKNLNEYIAGRMRPEKLLQRLNNNESFVTGAGKNHANFMEQKDIKKYSKAITKFLGKTGAYGVGTGLAGAIGYGLAKNSYGGGEQ